jgi:transposase
MGAAGGVVVSGQQLLVKRLGALPVIRAYLERLGLRERVDALAPVREVAHLTNGAVVEALVANRLTAPRPLYDIVAWAEEWAVEETFGLPPAALNDDRLGRCLDDLARVHDALRGAMTVQAIQAFGLATKALRWDLTSVLVTGEYPADEQAAEYARVQYGYGSGAQKQVRYLQVTTTDGAVPVWDQPWDGNTTDVATVIDTMRALREHARCTDFVLIGDSKLLSAANRQALLAAELGYLAPLARTPELDAAFRAIPAEQFQALAYVSARDQARPAEERASYQGWETTTEIVGPPAGEAAPRWMVRRVFVISSEERAACRRNRARQQERAAAEIARVCRQVGTRWCPTAERAQVKLETILERRHLRDLYRVTTETGGERPEVRCALIPDALARAEALDGYYVLETTRTVAEADASGLLAEWKGQWEIEHRHRAAKGPLRIRPLFVSSNQRIVGLITILGLALLVFSLMEREARRALGPAAKVPNLLAGHVAARPTGENLLKALREIALASVEIAGERYRLVAELSQLQQTLLALLGVPEQAYAQAAASSS